jgi:uncharacterized surface protein with fasciclin (FAS1) repeats
MSNRDRIQVLALCAALIAAGGARAEDKTQTGAAGAKVGSSNLWVSIEASQCCSKFLAAARVAGVEDLLKDAKQSYTVLVPTDDAWSKVPKATMDGLMKDPATLRKVLLNHVLAGKVKIADVGNGSSLKPICGDGQAGASGACASTAGAAKPTAAAGAPTSRQEQAGTILLEPKPVPLEVRSATANSGASLNGAGLVKTDQMASNGVFTTIDAFAIRSLQFKPQPGQSGNLQTR